MFTETVTSVHHWSSRTFSFRTTRSPGFKFNAGEFVLVGIDHQGERIVRAYSIVSPPWSNELEFLSIKLDTGKLTSKLQHIKIGDPVVIGKKPTGTLRSAALTPGSKLWLLATGTGLAPFVSLVRDPDTLDTWSQIKLVHSARHADDLAYTNHLTSAFETCAETEPLHPTIKLVLTYQKIVTSAGDARITTQLFNGLLNFNVKEDRMMVCGNMEFNQQVVAWCRDQGLAEGSLRQPGQFVVERAFIT